MKPIPWSSLTAAAVVSMGLLVASCASTPVSSSDATEPVTPTSETVTSTTDAPTAQPTANTFDKPVVFADEGVAIRGADPVAYFTQNAYVPGGPEFSYDWQGATWQFSSAENRDLFASNPEQYAPQYGGYCAWAVSQGYTAPVDPTAWKVVDGKLYLNYDAGIQKRWARDIPGNIAKADQNWPTALNQ
jgi:YHS domain-containing protein